MFAVGVEAVEVPAELAPEAAGVAFELPGHVVEVDLEVGYGPEVEVEPAHMMKFVAVLVLQAEFVLVVDHTVGMAVVDTEHTVGNSAGKGHSKDTSDNTVDIAAIAAADAIVE